MSRYRSRTHPPHASPAELRAYIEGATLPNNVADLLDCCAEDTPEVVALDFFEDQRQLTYRELAESVRRVAQGLSVLGVRKGTPVGVMTPNIIENPVAWLALLHLGAVSVPLNPSYTARELEFVLADSGARALITVPFVHALLEECDSAKELLFVVTIDGGQRSGSLSWDNLPAYQGHELPNEEVGPGDLANIQYTSGTTGFPKGCLLTHRYWLQLGWVVAEEIETPLERLLVCQPLFYMEPLYVLLMAMFHRATFCCARRMSSTRFIDWVKDRRANYCNFPAAILRQPPRESDAANALGFVHTFGIVPEQQHDVEKRFRTTAREAYGTTELGAVLYVPRAAADRTGTGTCGIPAPFREVVIATPTGEPVGVNELGELLVRGPGTTLGYHNNPEATAASVRNGWFRTGDLFRRDAEGWYTIVGRLADVIRRSGEFVSAREVEFVLARLAGISQAAVVGAADETRGEEVRACIVLAQAETPETVSPERIRSHCARLLAPFKVPRFVTYLEELPMTANGDKVNKPLLRGRLASSDARTFDLTGDRWL